MKNVPKAMFRFVESNLIVLLAIALLPVFLLTDNVDMFQSLVDHVFKAD
ncbi:hypothetical protein [Fictibacillus macauensis]|nr:hypothetical protein [Fictibacillus macauensis]